MSSSRARRSSRTEAGAAEQVTAGPPRLPEVTVGRLAGFKEGVPLVDYPGNPMAWPLEALTTAPLAGSEEGRDVALLFADGDAARPVVIGLLQRPSANGMATTIAGLGEGEAAEARVDGNRVVLEADEEIVLKCGKASITLTRAGKVLIRGAHLLNSSSGVNRIKGGSVQIN